MNIENVEVLQPLTLSKDDIEAIISRIQSNRILDENRDKDIFFVIAVSPNGDIIYPTEKSANIPYELAEGIYKNDKIFAMILDMYCVNTDCNGKDEFMIPYGYIEISGYTDKSGKFDDVYCKYNSQALTLTTRALPNSMIGYAKLIDKANDKRLEEYCKAFPETRDAIIKKLRGNDPTITDFNFAISKMSGEEIETFKEEIIMDKIINAKEAPEQRR